MPNYWDITKGIGKGLGISFATDKAYDYVAGDTPFLGRIGGSKVAESIRSNINSDLFTEQDKKDFARVTGNITKEYQRQSAQPGLGEGIKTAGEIGGMLMTGGAGSYAVPAASTEGRGLFSSIFNNLDNGYSKFGKETGNQLNMFLQRRKFRSDFAQKYGEIAANHTFGPMNLDAFQQEQAGVEWGMGRKMPADFNSEQSQAWRAQEFARNKKLDELAEIDNPEQRKAWMSSNSDFFRNTDFSRMGARQSIPLIYEYLQNQGMAEDKLRGRAVTDYISSKSYIDRIGLGDVTSVQPAITSGPLSVGLSNQQQPEKPSVTPSVPKAIPDLIKNSIQNQNQYSQGYKNGRWVGPLPDDNSIARQQAEYLNQRGMPTARQWSQHTNEVAESLRKGTFKSL